DFHVTGVQTCALPIFELSQSRLDIAEAQYSLGGAGKRDFLTAEVDYNSDLSLLLTQEQVIQNARVNLNELMALNPDQQFVVQDKIGRASCREREWMRE